MDERLVIVAKGEELRRAIRDTPAPERKPDRTEKSRHVARISGAEIAYEATAGTLTVGLPDKPKARMFYVAYVRTDTVEVGTRPITFCFNGGPGSSSVWLHVGCFGPRLVRVDAGAVPAPPYRAIDNAHSLLDVSDLVFVDPVGTGYSVPDEGDGEDYHSLDGDTRSVAEFVRLYVTKNGRWESPKYLAGESYGTTRSAALAKVLQEQGMYLNGIVLVSLALQFSTLIFEASNDLPNVLLLPTLAATAHHHGKVGGDLSALLGDAERFATRELLPALLLGDRVDDDECDRVADGLSRLTGLDAGFVRRCGLRVSLQQFCRELLRDQQLVVGRLDGRFVGRAADPLAVTLDGDPSFDALLGPYGGVLHEELRRIGYTEDEPYRLLSIEVNERWNFDAKNRFVDVAPSLRDALIANGHLRVLVASGRYDLATPYAATDFTLSRLGAGPAARARVRHEVYDAGHMIYAHEPSHARFKQHLVAFYQGA